jgi:hypothetical protein
MSLQLLSNENDNRALVSVFRGKIARCRFSPSYHGRDPNQPTALRAVCSMTLSTQRVCPCGQTEPP